jgi:hypothetical protein
MEQARREKFFLLVEPNFLPCKCKGKVEKVNMSLYEGVEVQLHLS